MNKKLNCILLVDDDESCSFFHQLLFDELECTEKLKKAYDGEEALHFLVTKKDGVYPKPALLFLDINMPKINGWEFLDRYEKLDAEITADTIVVMLTSSLNPDDVEKAKKYKRIADFKTKFLNKEVILELLQKHFPSYL